MCIAKKLNIGVNAPKYYEYSQFNKTEEYLNEYKKRARIEGKNAEMKRFHGLARARGYGLKSVEIQAKLTAIAVNLKKIGKLFSLNIPYNLDKFLILIKYSKKLLKIVFKSFLLPLFQWFRTSPCVIFRKKLRSCNDFVTKT